MSVLEYLVLRYLWVPLAAVGLYLAYGIFDGLWWLLKWCAYLALCDMEGMKP